MNRFASLLAAGFLLGCTTPKYLGTTQRIFSEFACPLDQEYCEFGDDEISIRYFLGELSAGNFALKGRVKWKSEDQAAVLVNIKRMDLYFIFFDGAEVVHEEKIRLRGDADEFIPFRIDFTTASNIESSMVVEYRGRVSE